MIIGPESTGKSTLCLQLAAHYNTVWVPEYAREFLSNNNNKYDYDDLLTIAQGQLALEDQYERSLLEHINIGLINNSLVPLFIDTDMYVMKVWCEFVFGKCHAWILEQASIRVYDHYLLCNTDLPWVKDALREYPDLETRKKLFLIYKDILVNQTTPWSLVSGGYEQRLKIATTEIDKHFHF